MICKKCLMPDSRPRIVFTDGVCNACRFHEDKKSIDWGRRISEFSEIAAQAEKRNAQYHCVVPFSGGKDSATIAWRLKYQHGLNPLLVTYGQLLWTDVGQHNFNQVAEAGFDILYWRVNQEVSRKLARRFTIERAHPKQHYDAGVNAVPVITARKFGIPLIFYAEHGESEYGGLVLSEEHQRTRDLAEVLENQIGDDPRNWEMDGITERDLAPYIYPEDVEGITAYYYSYFFPWDIYENAKFARDKMNFKQARNVTQKVTTRSGERFIVLKKHSGSEIGPSWWGKSDGSFEGFDSIDDKIDDLDFYLMWVKFGFGRATRMASRLIQGGHLTRDQGQQLVNRYDGEFPETYLKDVLEYLRMTRDELEEVIANHTPAMRI